MIKKFIFFVLLMNVVPFVYHNRFLGVHSVLAADVFDDEDGEDDGGGGDDGGGDGDDGCSGQPSSTESYDDYTWDSQGNVYADQTTTAVDACGNSTSSDDGQVLMAGPTDTLTQIVNALNSGTSMNDATPEYTLADQWTDGSGNQYQVNIPKIDFFSTTLFFSYCTWSAFFTDTAVLVGSTWKFTSQNSVKYNSSRRTQGSLINILSDNVTNIASPFVQTDLLHCNITMSYDVEIYYTILGAGSTPYANYQANVQDVLLPTKNN